MRALIAPDKFKGSLSAMQVCHAISRGIHNVDSGVSIVTVPMADGGEGTSKVLTDLNGGKMISTIVTDPLGRKINAEYGLSQDLSTAFIEMASASGLSLLRRDEQNPAYTSTVGTGELIRHAIASGVKKIIIGIGGSATNDAGTGMATALGIRFLDVNGFPVVPIGENIGTIVKVDRTNVHPALKGIQFIVLSDVRNPFFGPDGAARVFGPQKGADLETIKRLDKGMTDFADMVLKKYHVDLNFAGAGAAGGLGGGARFFLNARIESGIDFMIRQTSLEKRITEADIVISGEGKIDRQTLSGKVVSGISNLCRLHAKPLWIIAGASEITEAEVKSMGISRLVTLTDSDTSAERAIAEAEELIAIKTAHLFESFSFTGLS